MERIEISYYTCIEDIPVHRNMITVYPLQNTSPLKEALASCLGGMTYISWGAHSEN